MLVNQPPRASGELTFNNLSLKSMNRKFGMKMHAHSIHAAICLHLVLMFSLHLDFVWMHAGDGSPAIPSAATQPKDSVDCISLKFCSLDSPDYRVANLHCPPGTGVRTLVRGGRKCSAAHLHASGSVPQSAC